MITPVIDRVVLAVALTTAAAPCLAQSGPYPPLSWPGEEQYQAPPSYPYRSPQPYWYAPARPYRYSAPQSYSYSPQAYGYGYGYGAPRAYQHPAERSYGYSTQQPYRYEAPRQSAPRQWAYQPSPRADTVASAPAVWRQSPEPAFQSQPSSDGALLMPNQQASKNVISAASAPLHDLNLSSRSIPPVLMAALADPYTAPPSLDCASLDAAVDELTQAIGPDYDNRPPEHAKGVAESGGLGLTLMHGAAASLLPYSGFIRTLSGAAQHDDLIIKALAAGGARRAYLKGLGQDRQCAGEASPHHPMAPAAAVYSGPTRPKYPIWWDRAG